MKRKIIALALAILMISVSLVGCFDPAKPEITTPEAPDADTTPAVTTTTPDATTTVPSTPKATTPAPEPEGITVNGTLLEEYTVVIPAAPTPYEQYAAEFFVELIEENTGITLSTASDTEEEGKYEILVGATSRTSGDDAVLSSGKYMLYADGDKIICRGYAYLVGAGLYELASSIPAGTEDLALTVSTSSEPRTHSYKTAKNAILLIGDGMGKGIVDWALELGICSHFYGRDLSVSGFSRTDNVYGSTTDSAAGGTALATGQKTVNGYIGMDKNGAPIQNVRELAHSIGAKTAVLSTDAITGATPASFLTHNISRNNTAQISMDITRLQSANEIDYCRGSIGDDLLDRTEEALELISGGGSRFFMMLEEGYIDKHSHSNDATNASKCVDRLSGVIAYCAAFTVFHPDTALVVTADHETGGVQGNAGNFTYTSSGHTGTMVPIYACGAGTNVLKGAVQNTEIAKYLFSIYE